MLAAYLSAEWWRSKPNVALVLVSSCFDVPGTLGEQWYFTAVFIEEPGRVQISQILNVKKGWLAEMLRHLFVAVKCDQLISSYPEVVSSSMRGDADTINLLSLLRGRWDTCCEWRQNSLISKHSSADLTNALLYMWVKLRSLSGAVGEMMVFLTVAALFCSLGYPCFKIHAIASLNSV